MAKTKGKKSAPLPTQAQLLQLLGAVLNDQKVVLEPAFRTELMDVARQLWNKQDADVAAVCAHLDELLRFQILAGGIGLPAYLKSLYLAVHRAPTMRDNINRGAGTAAFMLPIWFGR